MASFKTHADAWIQSPEVEANQARDLALAQRVLGVAPKPRADGRAVGHYDYDVTLPVDSHQTTDLRALLAKLPPTCRLFPAESSSVAHQCFRLRIARVGMRRHTPWQWAALLTCLVLCLVLTWQLAARHTW